jgi:hypothetical protein
VVAKWRRPVATGASQGACGKGTVSVLLNVEEYDCVGSCAHTHARSHTYTHVHTCNLTQRTCSHTCSYMHNIHFHTHMFTHRHTDIQRHHMTLAERELLPHLFFVCVW